MPSREGHKPGAKMADGRAVGRRCEPFVVVSPLFILKLKIILRHVYARFPSLSAVYMINAYVG